MNTGPLRKMNAPATPNLEEIKQKNKSKSRRKPYSIQPTNPPTPKPHKAQIVIKQNMQKLNENMRLRQQFVCCTKHPDRPAANQNDNANNKRMCNKCYHLPGKQQQSETEQENSFNDISAQLEKKRQLDDFKGRIKGFGLKIEQAFSSYSICSHESEQNFYRQKQYIIEAFENIQCVVQEKKRKLLNDLMRKQQAIKKSLLNKNAILEQIKSSIYRYMSDIDSNYEQIIQSLSLGQFNEIIEKYNEKIQYFQNSLEGIVFQTAINVFVPTTEIKTLIDNSDIQTYPFEAEDNLTFKNKTLQRYPTQKHNIITDHQHTSHRHHESLNNRFTQHRGSRDRYEHNLKEISVGPIRNHTNKQNFYYQNGR